MGSAYDDELWYAQQERRRRKASPKTARPRRRKVTPLDEIGNERARQVGIEGWSAKHDDQHRLGELAKAAATYALYAGQERYDRHGNPPASWPWDSEWWKPKDARRDLVRAGALIIAEIERLDRAHSSQMRGEK